jgi:hypothetical protein
MSEELDVETWQIVQAYRHLMTAAERRAERAFVFQAKMESAGGPAAVQRYYDWMQETLDDPNVWRLFKKGRVRLLKDAAERILDEHRDEIMRCDKCGGVLRTPKARQCFNCGYDWHGPNRVGGVIADPAPHTT